MAVGTKVTKPLSSPQGASTQWVLRRCWVTEWNRIISKKCLLSATGRGMLLQILTMLLSQTNKVTRLLTKGSHLSVKRTEEHKGLKLGW